MMTTTIYVNGSRRVASRQRGTNLVAKWVYAIFGLRHRPRMTADRLTERMRRDIGLSRANCDPGRRMR